MQTCLGLVPGNSVAERTPAAPSVGFSASPSSGDFGSWEKACLDAERTFLRSRALEAREAAEVTSPDKSGKSAADGSAARSAAESNDGVPLKEKRKSSLAPRTISFAGDRGQTERGSVRAAAAGPAPSASAHSNAIGGPGRIDRSQRNSAVSEKCHPSLSHGNHHRGSVVRPGTVAPPPPANRCDDDSIASVGLPDATVEYFRKIKRVERLYPWQRACLGLEGVFDHRSNLVYCAPTSGGKSLVSDTLLIRRLHSVPGSIGIMVLPFVSLCRERADELERMLGPESKIQVRRFFGGGGGRLPPPDGGGGLLVCTPEKFNDVMTRLIEEERTRELSSVVVDELHMVQDSSRGGTLELALTKLLFAARKAVEGHYSTANARGDGEETHDHLVPLTEPSGFSGDFGDASASSPQIIGMSATLADIDGLARWFDAKLFETDFRPVPLRTHVVTGGEVFRLRTSGDGGTDEDEARDPSAREEDVPPPLDPRRRRLLPPAAVTETDQAVELVREAFADEGEDAQKNVTRRGGVIVFCAAKFQCEATANALVAKLANDAGLADPGSGPDASVSARAALVDELRRLSPSARDTETEKKRSLATCASRGVVWHHSALRAEEKALVEKGFREGAFRVVCCTTTMATGVNLPAKRVVVATPYVYRKKPTLHEVLKARDLQQMVGRAGRAGFGADVGDAFVVCPRAADVRWQISRKSASSAVSATQKNATDAPSDARALALEMAARLSSDGEALSSTIAQAGMRRVMLEAVACGLARTPGDIKAYIQCTLLSALNDFQDVVAKGATGALRWLSERSFLLWDAESQKWQPTPLGRAAAAAHLDPDRAVAVVADVRRARRCLILETDLHLLFLCVPPDPPAAADVEEALTSGDRNDAPVASRGTNERASSRVRGGGKPVVDDECWLNRSIFVKIYGRLTDHERFVAETVGITEAYYGRLVSGSSDRTKEHRASRRICHRFLKALALHDVVCERDVHETAEAFGMSPGLLAQTQEAAARHAGQVAAVCGPMGFGDVEALVTRLQDRIAAGAKEEILGLTSIPGIGASRARALYTAGYRTPEAILAMSAKTLAAILQPGAKGGAGAGRGVAQMILRGARRLCAEQRSAAREASEAKLRELQRLAPIAKPALGELDEAAFGFADNEEIEPLSQEKDASASPETKRARAAEAFNPASARGAVAVRLPEHLERLEAFWRAAPSYAFVLRPGTRAVTSLGTGPNASPPVAIALAFASNPEATFYARVVVGPPRRDDEGDADADADDAGPGLGPVPGPARRGFAWETVRSILATPGARKSTVDLKPQLRAMGAADAVVGRLDRDGGWSVGRVAPPFLDVRVAGWLLRPESAELACGVGAGWARLMDGGGSGGASEALARAFAGEIDQEATRRASVWPGLGLTNAAGAVETSRARRNRAAAAATTRAAATVLAAEAAIETRFASSGAFESVRDAMERVEMPLIAVLASMEAEGVPFAPGALESQIRRANARLLEIEAEAAATLVAAGAAPASLTSSADVARVLFEDLALPPPPCAAMDAGAKAGVRRRRQRFKTDGETLRALESQHAFPALVLEHRSLSKCAGAAEELVDLARSAGFVAGDGEACVRLRGTIHQTNAETGRLAMEEPNLQTIPRAVAVVGNDARDAGEGPSSLAVRGAFRAPAGRVLLSADYKQLELRVAAHLSGDEALLRAFENEQDPFGALASRWRGKTEFAAVDENDRAAAKRLAYAALFGGGVSKFAAETGCDEATARALMDTFKASMPGVERWRLSVVKEAAERTPPHVVTQGGRRRHLPGLAGNFAGAAFAAEARMAVNTTCQGSAADIVKRAMLDVFGKLTCSGSHGHENGAPSDARDASDDDDAPTWRRLRAGGCRLVLQVHDELVFELDEADAVAAVGAIRRVMERAARAFSLRVSLPVKVSVGWDYGEMTVAEY